MRTRKLRGVIVRRTGHTRVVVTAPLPGGIGIDPATVQGAEVNAIETSGVTKETTMTEAIPAREVVDMGKRTVTTILDPENELKSTRCSAGSPDFHKPTCSESRSNASGPPLKLYSTERYTSGYNQHSTPEE